MKFPFRIYSAQELQNEYERLRCQPEFELKRTLLGYKCSNAFFQKERMQASSLTKLSGVKYWKKNESYIIDYCKNSGKKDLFNAVQFLNHTPAQFPPSVAAYIYSYFQATHVLDPFAGWGDRCLAAMALDIDYIGIDSNIDLKKAYSSMVKFYPHNSQVKMIYKPVEKINLDNLEFDFVFSSPPFWEPSGHLSETYKHMPCTELDMFVDMFVDLIGQCLSRGAWCCFYMSEFMAKSIPVKWNKKLRYTGAGNKKNQVYFIYCYAPTLT